MSLTSALNRSMLGGMGRPFAACIILSLVAGLSSIAAGAVSSIHTVVSTECTDEVYFEWQVLGLAYR